MRRILTLVLGVLGFFTALKLSQIYFNANFATNYAGSFCSINSVVDCDGVARSAYSTFLGIPWSMYGMLFYLMVIGLSYIDVLAQKFRIFRFFQDFKHPENYIYLMAMFSVFLSLYLGWVSTFQIHKICLLCYVSYAINFLLFMLYVTKLSLRESVRVSVEDTKSFLQHSVNKKFFSIFFALAFGFVFFANQTQVFIPTSFTHLFQGNVLGKQDAKARVIVYTDYQCPYCSILNNELFKLAHNLGNVRFDLVDFPLDSECNPLISNGDGHEGSCLAARYALASKKQCKFLELNSLLFRYNYNLSEDNILRLAKKVGLDVEKLKKDANSQEVKNLLSSKINKALAAGVKSTPTIQVGLKVYNYFMPYDELYDVVSDYKKAVDLSVEESNAK